MEMAVSESKWIDSRGRGRNWPETPRSSHHSMPVNSRQCVRFLGKFVEEVDRLLPPLARQVDARGRRAQGLVRIVGDAFRRKRRSADDASPRRKRHDLGIVPLQGGRYRRPAGGGRGSPSTDPMAINDPMAFLRMSPCMVVPHGPNRPHGPNGPHARFIPHASDRQRITR